MAKLVHDSLSCQLEFHGQREVAFEERAFFDFSRVLGRLSARERYRHEFPTSFPHSAGIASSASAMSALALCLVDIDTNSSTNLDGQFKL